MNTWEGMMQVLAQCKSDGDRRRFNELVNGSFCEAPHCEKFGELRHQHTAYEHLLSNWARLCEGHQAEADQYWQEMWDEYYADVL